MHLGFNNYYFYLVRAPHPPPRSEICSFCGNYLHSWTAPNGSPVNLRGFSSFPYLPTHLHKKNKKTKKTKKRNFFEALHANWYPVGGSKIMFKMKTGVLYPPTNEKGGRLLSMIFRNDTLFFSPQTPPSPQETNTWISIQTSIMHINILTEHKKQHRAWPHPHPHPPPLNEPILFPKKLKVMDDP